MPKTAFRCTKCKRKFSMAAHLARHMSAIHKRKGAGKTAGGGKRKLKARAGRPKLVSAKAATRSKKSAARSFRFTGDGSARVISEMRAYHGRLLAQRDSLDAQIDAFARAMQTLGTLGPMRRKPRKPRKPAKGRTPVRGPRPGSLRDFIARVLRQSSKPMSPSEIGNSVRKAGFNTKAKDFTKAVSNTIPTMTDVEKVGFGLYQFAGRAK